MDTDEGAGIFEQRQEWFDGRRIANSTQSAGGAPAYLRIVVGELLDQFVSNAAQGLIQASYMDAALAQLDEDRYAMEIGPLKFADRHLRELRVAMKDGLEDRVPPRVFADLGEGHGSQQADHWVLVLQLHEQVLDGRLIEAEFTEGDDGSASLGIPIGDRQPTRHAGHRRFVADVA